MKIPEFINDFNLPIRTELDSDYYQKLEEILEKYKTRIKNYKSLQEKSKLEIMDNCDSIINSLQEYYRGNISTSQIIIQNILSKYNDDNHPFIISEFGQSYAIKGNAPLKIRPSSNEIDYNAFYDSMMKAENFFFRARVSSCSSLKDEDMLHIPFSSRSKVSTQRFSMPGIPCLYFSTTSYGTWIEMGRPPMDEFFVSCYKIDKKIKILNLCIQQHLINGQSSQNYTDSLEDHALIDMLSIFPLVIASSFSIKEYGRIFKSEYIISQLIMQSVNNMGINAIAYLSKKAPDIKSYPLAVNIAIIMRQDDVNQKYSDFLEKIEMTSPIIFEYFVNSPDYKTGLETDRSYILGFFSHETIKEVGTTVEYENTDFAKFDSWICSRPFKKAHSLIPCSD